MTACRCQNYPNMIAKSEIPNIFVVCVSAIFCPQYAAAQFNTITKESPVTAEMHKRATHYIENKDDTIKHNELPPQEAVNEAAYASNSVRAHGVTRSKSHRKHICHTDSLPDLTIPNLVEEIRKNGIKYPKIVLAQAILETGWFKSSVCRNKHNLFGLTNPRTGEYYEFAHWKESVRAYYTKVQYRYWGGNYLLWLKNIGYAEDPGYIRAVIRVLKQL